MCLASLFCPSGRRAMPGPTCVARTRHCPLALQSKTVSINQVETWGCLLRQCNSVDCLPGVCVSAPSGSLASYPHYSVETLRLQSRQSASLLLFMCGKHFKPVSKYRTVLNNISWKQHSKGFFGGFSGHWLVRMKKNLTTDQLGYIQGSDKKQSEGSYWKVHVVNDSLDEQ